jgi:hypothetical protein
VRQLAALCAGVLLEILGPVCLRVERDASDDDAFSCAVCLVLRPCVSGSTLSGLAFCIVATAMSNIPSRGPDSKFSYWLGFARSSEPRRLPTDRRQSVGLSRRAKRSREHTSHT